MDISDFVSTFDSVVNTGLRSLEENFGFFFDVVQIVFESVYEGISWLLLLAPFYVVAMVVAVLGWRIVNLRTGVLLSAGLILCALMGLWTDTMSTLALVIAATFFALLVAIPGGILAGYLSMVNTAVSPILDLLQTFPPYIYLLPGIALLGYGPATALLATMIFAIPPAFRLTSLGIRMTPRHFVELGQVTGMSGWQMFFKIRLPFAMPSVMAGINQSIMLAFGMVVIAGIVGSGGLGQTIYQAILRLEIAKSIDATIAIVVLTLVLDRLTQGLASTRHGESN